MADRNHPRTPLPRRQSADRGRVGGRAATRGSSVKFGTLSSAIVKKSKGDSGPDIKGALIERDQTRNQTLSNSIAAALNDSVALAKEQNDLLSQIVNELKGVVIPAARQPSGGGGGTNADIDVDVDVDRDKRGRGQRGRFGARGRERLQKFREFKAARGATPRPTAPAARSVGSTMRTVGQAFARVTPSLGAAAAPAAAIAAGAASLGIIGTAAYRAATMSPEERQAIQQRAEEQAAAGREALTPGQQSGRGVGQGLRAGYYGDQPADLRLEDILDTLDTPAENETREQRTARERMATELTRGNGRPTPEMIEYVRSRRAAVTEAPATPVAPPPPATPAQSVTPPAAAPRTSFLGRISGIIRPRAQTAAAEPMTASTDGTDVGAMGLVPGAATSAVSAAVPELSERDSGLLDQFLRVRGITSESPNYNQAREVLQRYIASRGGSIDDVTTRLGMESRLAGMLPAAQNQASSRPSATQSGTPRGRAGQTQHAEQIVQRMLNVRRQPDRLDEVMDHLKRLYPRGIPSNTFLIESRVRDYLDANPGVSQPVPVSPESTTDVETLTPPGAISQMKSDDTQDLLTNLSSGRSAAEIYAKDTVKSMPKGKSTGVVKSPDYISALLGMLSGTEFREIKFEADTFEFDGRVSLSRTEASLVSPTAFISHGQYESEAPTDGGQSSGSSSTGGSSGGQSFTSAPSSRPSFQQGAVASRSSSAASPVASPGATPSISGGFEGAGGGEGSISQIIQSGPGFNLVQYDDGRIERRTGSRNWRNNNPGNLEFGDFARRYGAIGSDGRFAIFPTYEAGKRAKEALLFEGRGYAGMTIAQAITRYAPPNENDTAMYIRTAAAAAGVSPNTLMGDLNAEQRQALLAAMERVEGFRVGRVDVVQQGTAVAAAQPPAGGAGAGLGAESTGMVAADQAQAMGAGRQVVVQLPNGGAAGAQGSASVQASSGPTAEVSLNRRLEGQVS